MNYLKNQPVRTEPINRNTRVQIQTQPQRKPQQTQKPIIIELASNSKETFPSKTIQTSTNQLSQQKKQIQNIILNPTQPKPKLKPVIRTYFPSLF